MPQAECLCIRLAVCNQVEELTSGECTSVLGQKKSEAHIRVGVLQILFLPSGKYTHDFKVCTEDKKVP